MASAGASKAKAAFTQITAGVGDAKVTAGKVSTDGDTATGSCDWRWQVGSKTWSYDTTVKLTKGTTRRPGHVAGALDPDAGRALAEGR